MDPVVSIIVVSYNTKEMTLDCLRSIVRETPDLTYEVLFIDNQSTDGSWKAVQEELKNDDRFTLRLSDKNLGFAGANNEMAKHARGEYILLLNPDTVVLDRAIEKLVHFAREYPENGIWGGRTVFPDGSLNPGSAMGDYTLWSMFCSSSGLRYAFPESSLFNPRAYPGWQRDSQREVGIIEGSFFLITSAIWDKLSGFDHQFFMYGEESDLCIRAKASGARPLFCPLAEIVHYGGKSEKSRAGKLVKLYDAELRIARLHFSPFCYRLARYATITGVISRAIVERIVALCSKHQRDDWRRVWRQRADWLGDD